MKIKTKQSKQFLVRDTTLSVLTLLCISYFLGNLVVDLVFDFSVTRSIRKIYYCSLVSSLTSSFFGALRLVLPSILLAASLLCRLFRGGAVSGTSFWYQTFFSAVTLVFGGLPLLVYNLYSVHQACAVHSDTELWPDRTLKATHVMLLSLFSVLVCTEFSTLSAFRSPAKLQ